MKKKREKKGGKSAFEIKLTDYYQDIKNWIESEKPYLRKDFRLREVSEKLPLCRSYLSRIFNEGFGDSFSNVVKRYRIEEARELLRDRPDLMISDISEICGFSTPSTFHRAFVMMNDGLTPGDYRKMCR